MSEGPAEKKDGFERWVASLKHEARTLNVPGARVETEHDSSEPPPNVPLTFDEQVTLVQRLPKDIVKALRERESQRATRDSSYPPLTKVDEESTAVFVPPPELLARAKRFQPPPKPGRGSSPSHAIPPPPSESEAPQAPEAKSPNELPTMPPPAEDSLYPNQLGHAVSAERKSAPGHAPPSERKSAPGHAPPSERKSAPGHAPASERKSAAGNPAPHTLASMGRTPAMAFPAAHGPAKTAPAGGSPAPRGPTPAFGFPAQGMPRGAARPVVTRATSPGVPSSVPRGFSAALFPAAAPTPAPAPAPSSTPAPLDAVETEEPTSRAQFAPPGVLAQVRAAPILNLPAAHAPFDTIPEPPDFEPSVAQKVWDEEEAATLVISEDGSIAPPSSHASSAPADASASTAPEAGDADALAKPSTPPSGTSKYLLLLGWVAAALLIFGAVWLTYLRK
jgi:hypothetical protein